MEKRNLITGQIYHIFTKSIAGFKVFNNDIEFKRFKNTFVYYQKKAPLVKFSWFIKSKEIQKTNSKIFLDNARKENLVNIVAYCIMPTHIHFILEQTMENGISTFMSNTLNSYTRYFNTSHNRKGPLWEGKFKSIIVGSDVYLVHLTRYLHLNPVTALIIETPDKWKYSSYPEYIADERIENKICNYTGILEIKPDIYKAFVEDRISYQKELAKIKDLIIE
ncbi:MAG: transposase [Elusimicrobia bacterium]|nr:transposase [Elusimicrobiota bacterium]